MLRFCFLCLTVFAAGACRQKPTEPLRPALPPGATDFSRYVAVGGSLTAGFMDGGLYRAGQLASYPNRLAERFRLAGGESFVQPLFSEEQRNGSGYLRLTGTSPLTGLPIVANVTTNLAIRSTSPVLFTRYSGPAPDNLGIPGLRLLDGQTASAGSEAGNPYLERLLPAGQPPQSYLAYLSNRVRTNPPTFFTVWVGNEDIWTYVRSGGTQPLPDAAAFTTQLTALLDVLHVNGAQGVLATLPDPAQFPYVTARTLAQLRGNSNATLYVRTGTGAVRPATPTDRILLDADSVGVANRIGLNKGYFSAYPLGDEDVLDADELQALQRTVGQLNERLTNEAAGRNLPVVDAPALWTRLGSGTTQSGVTRSIQPVIGSFYSLDGIHPTPAGQLLLANEFLRVINRHYGTSLPQYELE